ncbi:hypothetical protein J3F83DRAFT_313888 [Trichoderma novae-zelandiae]
MLQRHALVTSCMRVHAPCQAVDRPSCQKAANIAEQGGFPGLVLCKVHMRPSQLGGSELSILGFIQYSRATYAAKVRCMGRSALLKRWLRFTSHGSHVVVSCPPAYSFRCSNWTSDALSVPALRPVVLLFDQRNAVRAPPGGQIRVTGDALRDEKTIAQSFHHAYKLTIYTCFIPLH